MASMKVLRAISARPRRASSPHTPGRRLLGRPVLGEDPLHRGRRMGVGLRLGVFGRVVDGGRDRRRRCRASIVVGQDAGVAQLGAGTAAAGSSALLGGQLLLGAVLGLLVVR